MSEETEIDCKYTDNCVCPYCGHEDKDSWEIRENSKEGYCDSCDKKFSIEQEFSRTFCTSKTCQTNDDCQFREWQIYIKDVSSFRSCKICGRHEYKQNPLFEVVKELAKEAE